MAHRRPRTARTSDRQQDELERCRGPITRASKAGTRQDAVLNTLLDQTSDASTYGVDAAAFLAFAGRLEAMRLPAGRLADGADAWIAAIRAPRFTPEPDLCTVLKHWSDTGFATSAEPAGPDVYGLDEEIRTDPRISAAGDVLRDLGASVREQRLFAGDIFALERYIDF